MSNIFDAIRNSDTKLIESLAKSNPGLLPELLREENSEGLQPLHYAAKWGTPEIIKLLIHWWADPNGVASSHNRTPLCFVNTLEKAKILIELGADPSAMVGPGFNTRPSDWIQNKEILDYLRDVLKEKHLRMELEEKGISG